MEMIKDVKEVFVSSLEASQWVAKTFENRLQQEDVMNKIIENKKNLGFYCYGNCNNNKSKVEKNK